MKISRRNFIKAGFFASAFAGTALFVPASSSRKKFAADDLSLIENSKDPLSNKTAEDFRRYIGAEFMLLTAGGSVSTVLTEVSESKNVVSGGRLSQSPKVKNTARNFVLSFQMPTGDFSQETYQLWHPDFGQFDLFLVPNKCGTPFLLYAVINRL